MTSREQVTGGAVLLGTVAAGGLAFQVLHLGEHAAQLAYWFAHPGQPPWMSSPAQAATGFLAGMAGGDRLAGMELLHLLGNLVFLTGLLACLARRRHAEAFPGLRHLQAAAGLQALHVGEHIALTATAVIGGKALGFSTVFGTLAGPELTAARVWFHFLINLAASLYTARYLAAAATRRRHRNSAAPGVETVPATADSADTAI